MKKKLTYDDFVNMWLEPYHKTNVDEVKEKHGWKDGEDHSREFYDTYCVTQEQHDEWYDRAISKVMKQERISKKSARRQFVWVYLDVSPSICKDAN